MSFFSFGSSAVPASLAADDNNLEIQEQIAESENLASTLKTTDIPTLKDLYPSGVSTHCIRTIIALTVFKKP